MERDDLIALWEKVESEIRIVISRIGARLPTDEVQDMEDYLDHNELSLAWELLTEAIVVHEIEVSDEDIATLRRAAGRMSLDLNLQPQWKRLIGPSADSG